MGWAGSFKPDIWPGRASVSYSYDAHKRLIGIEAPNGATTRLQRDGFGRVTASIDPLGGTTRFFYEESPGKDFYAPTRIERADGAIIRFQFDIEGRVEEFQDGAGRIWRYRYGPFDLPLSLEEPGGGVLHFQHDLLQRLVSVTNAKGAVWRFERDAAGRVIRETDFNHLTHDYAYDAAGRLAEMRRPNGARLVFAYDRTGSLLSETAYEAGAAEPFETAAYEYDARGLLCFAENGAALIRLERDAAGRVVAETCNGRRMDLARDGSGRVAERRIGAGLLAVTHDPLGLVGRLTIGDHAPLDFTRNAVGAETRRGSGAGFYLAHSYDSLGVLLEQRAGFSPASLGADGARLSYERGIGADRVAQLVRGYRWTAGFEPDSIADSHWGKRDYRYDPNGQLTAAIGDDGTEERFRYDPARELAGFSDGTLSYIVTDPLGTPKELFSEAGDKIWAADHRVWGQIRRLWQAPANDDQPPIPQGRGPRITGNLALKDDPDWTAAAQLCPIRFQGQWEDEETGLFYNRFRTYDPLTGQYLSPDPIGLAGGLRPHAYVDNPMSWVDPMGLKGAAALRRGEMDALLETGMTKAEIEEYLRVNGDIYLFRGTTPGYEGSIGTRSTATPATIDPYIATIFAMEAKEAGRRDAVILFGKREEIGTFGRGSYFARQEREVGMAMTPLEFEARAPHSISLERSREILEDMGFNVPRQVGHSTDRKVILMEHTPMTPEQIKEFIKRAGE